jgi:hypothetical protein
MAKKRQPKAGSTRKRRSSPGRSSGETGAERGPGLMQGMVGGFRRAVGVEQGSKRGTLGTALTVVLVVAALALLFYRLG